MPQAPKFEWPTGDPLFQVAFRSLSEAVAGNGLLDPSDLLLSSTANDNELQVDAGGVLYDRTEVNYGGGTLQISDGDPDNDRWDTVAFDADTGTPLVREGTPEQYPSPPDLQGDEVLLGYVYVPSGATDTPDERIKNWRSLSPQTFQKAVEVAIDDDAGNYSAENVEAALTEIAGTFDSVQSSITALQDRFPVQTGDLGDDAVTTAKIAQAAVTATEIANGAVETAGLADASVSTPKLQDEAVTEAKIASGVSLGGGGTSGAKPATFYPNDSGEVAAGEYDLVYVRRVPGDTELRLLQADLLLDDAAGRPSGLNLYLVARDSAGTLHRVGNVITASGEDGFEGVANYKNLTGSPRTVGVAVDNGAFGGGTGGTQSYVSSAVGELVEGVDETMIDISPTASAYDAHSGATFNAQDADNVAFYEINNEGDTVDFTLEQVPDMGNPTLIINTVFGPTGFEVQDRGDANATVVSEESGYDSDVWVVDLSDAATGELRLTNFTDPTAGFYAYVTLTDRQV